MTDLDKIRWRYEVEKNNIHDARIIDLNEVIIPKITNSNDYNQTRINDQEKKVRDWYIWQNKKNYDEINIMPIEAKYDLQAKLNDQIYVIELKERKIEIEEYSGSTMMQLDKLNQMIEVDGKRDNITCLYVNYYNDSHGLCYIEYNISNRIHSIENNELNDIQTTNCPYISYRDKGRKDKEVIYLKFDKKFGDKLVMWGKEIEM